MESFRTSVDEAVKALTMKGLRDNLRARGLNPAGGMDALRARLGDHMVESRDLALVDDVAGMGRVPTPPAGEQQRMLWSSAARCCPLWSSAARMSYRKTTSLPCF
jgi:SPIRAL1-like protein